MAVFLGELSQAKIAEKYGISLNVIESWIKHDAFHARLDELRSDFQRRFIEQGIPYVSKEQRVVALSRKAASASQAYDDRPWVKDKRANPKGGVIVNEVYNDAAFNAFRGALDDIAKELGHRKAGVEVTGKDGGPMEIADVTDTLRRRLALIAAAGRAGSVPSQSDEDGGDGAPV